MQALADRVDLTNHLAHLTSHLTYLVPHLTQVVRGDDLSSSFDITSDISSSRACCSFCMACSIAMACSSCCPDMVLCGRAMLKLPLRCGGFSSPLALQ